MGELSKTAVWFGLLTAAIAASASASPAPVLAIAVDSQELGARARTLPLGGELRLQGIALDDGDDRRTLELERFRVFAADARIVVHGATGDRVLPVPDHAYFRGHVTGEPRSRVWLTALQEGGLRGLISNRGEYWVMAADGGEAPVLSVRAVDPTELAAKVAGFECAQADGGAATALPAEVIPTGASKGTAVGYTAQVAIETDFEFWQRFGNDADATAYVGDLIGYASTVFADEVDTSLEISYISLWSTSADPWHQSPGLCALFEFGRWWNLNRDEERSVAHFLSGKSANTGIAWVGVLCRDAFSYNHGGACELSPETDLYGGDYGFSGGIDGNFNLGNPALIWDLLVVLHEIGHNFNSPHSHCYTDLGGNPQPVDECYAGQCGQVNCHCGATGLPCGGSGCGTLMSYCHLLSGGLSNISTTFGSGHPWGVEPERIPERMNAHVVSRANANPTCLDAAAGAVEIFSDGFDSGDVNAWTTAMP